jgi:hypothetical protein
MTAELLNGFRYKMLVRYLTVVNILSKAGLIAAKVRSEGHRAFGVLERYKPGKLAVSWRYFSQSIGDSANAEANGRAASLRVPVERLVSSLLYGNEF